MWLAVDANTSAHKIMIVVLAVVVVGIGNLAIVANTSARTVVVIGDVLVHTCSSSGARGFAPFALGHVQRSHHADAADVVDRGLPLPR